MGNRFGKFESTNAAEAYLLSEGFIKKASMYNDSGFIFAKPSTDGFGFPMTALVEITEGHVAAEYTASGTRETYYQHHFI